MISHQLNAATRPLIAIDEAMERLLSSCKPVSCQRIALGESVGRVLAESAISDRPSPAFDASAMDGITIRLADLPELSTGGLPISGEAAIGMPVRLLQAGTAMYIFTGGPVPDGAQVVIKREELEEQENTVRFLGDPGSISVGQHIRRMGENCQSGTEIAHAGDLVTPAMIGTLSSFGVNQPLVRRKVRVVILVTGDEIDPDGQNPDRTRLRDSNGPAIEAMLALCPWIEIVERKTVLDHPNALRAAIESAIEQADCVLSTGGVSMGDHDWVPEIVESLGAEELFHRLAIKPGKPVFAATVSDSKLYLGLPGNPVSALITARRVAIPALSALAGFAHDSRSGANATVTAANPDQIKAHPLTRFLLCNRNGCDRVEVICGKGSGDSVSSARSDGFIEVPPSATGDGDYNFYSWDCR